MSRRRPELTSFQAKTEKRQTLVSRLDAMNAVNSFINKLHPILLARLEEGVKYKENGKPYKKDNDQINELVNDLKTDALHYVYVNFWDSSDTVCVEIRANYKGDIQHFSDLDGTFPRKWESYTNHVYFSISNPVNFKPIKLYNAEEVEAAQQERADLESSIQILQDRSNLIKSEFML